MPVKGNGNKKVNKLQNKRLKRLEGLVVPDKEVFELDPDTTRSLNANGAVIQLFDEDVSKTSPVILSNMRNKLLFYNLSVNSMVVRVIYFMYKATVTADVPVAPGILDLLIADYPLALYKYSNRAKYRVWRDKTIVIDGAMPTGAYNSKLVTINRFKKQRLKASDQQTETWYPYMCITASIYMSSGIEYRNAHYCEYIKGC